MYLGRDIGSLEVELRSGQCNDSLKGVRLSLGKKVFLFRTEIRQKGPKTGKTKSWDTIHSTDQTLRLHAQIYRSAREALVVLEAPKLLLKRFKVLERNHLKTSTTLLDPCRGGKIQDPTRSVSKHDQLPWFWYLDVAGDSVSSNHLTECEHHCVKESSWIANEASLVHRVNWLRAKASFDRASEENILVKYEMTWTTRFFEHQAKQWKKRQEEGWSPGHDIYACKQVAMWAGFAMAARNAFPQVLP
jgi:hypothetical protein